jgi:hypothetical protein
MVYGPAYQVHAVIFAISGSSYPQTRHLRRLLLLLLLLQLCCILSSCAAAAIQTASCQLFSNAVAAASISLGSSDAAAAAAAAAAAIEYLLHCNAVQSCELLLLDGRILQLLHRLQPHTTSSKTAEQTFHNTADTLGAGQEPAAAAAAGGGCSNPSKENTTTFVVTAVQATGGLRPAVKLTVV